MPNCDTRLITDFSTDQSWELDPGDVLYLPPRVPHQGIFFLPNLLINNLFMLLICDYQIYCLHFYLILNSVFKLLLAMLIQESVLVRTA